VSTSPAPVELLELDLVARQPSGAALGRTAAGVLVLIGPRDPCGECEVCRRGGAAVCAHARRDRDGWTVRVSSRWIVELGDGLDLPAPAAAAVPGDVAIAYTLYARTGLAPRDPVVVLGDTAVTRFLVEILRAKGLTPVVVTSHAELGAWAATKGALVASEPSGVGAATATLGLGERPLRVIATAPSMLAAAAELAGPRATLTILAPAGDLPGALLAREVTIIGVAGAHPDLITEAAAMCAKGEIDLAGGVTQDPNDATRALVIVR
jgi:D-arabinose 1-dehydrogenase-like Zn-dependent alcohol dehydrogenase